MINTIDELLEIQKLLEQGINIAGIKKVFALKHETKCRTFHGKSLNHDKLRSIVQGEMQVY